MNINRLNKGYLTAILTSLVFLFPSCAYKTNLLGEPTSEYHRLLRKKSQKKNKEDFEKVIYKTTVIKWDASLRQAYVNEYALRFNLDETQKQKLMNDEMAREAKYHEFVVFHYGDTPERSFINGSSRDWMIKRILNDGTHQKPSKIDTLNKNSVFLEYFFPQQDSFSKKYRVCFDKNGNDSNDINVRIDGIEGNLEFKW